MTRHVLFRSDRKAGNQGVKTRSQVVCITRRERKVRGVCAYMCCVCQFVDENFGGRGQGNSQGKETESSTKSIYVHARVGVRCIAKHTHNRERGIEKERER